MNFDLVQLRAAADEAARLSNASAHGVAVSIEVVDSDYSFVIWSTVSGKMESIKLWGPATSLERLVAHVRGYVQNRPFRAH